MFFGDYVNRLQDGKNRGREKHCNFNTFRNYSVNMSFRNSYNLCKPRDGVPPEIWKHLFGGGVTPKTGEKNKKGTFGFRGDVRCRERATGGFRAMENRRSLPSLRGGIGVNSFSLYYFLFLIGGKGEQDCCGGCASKNTDKRR